MEQCRFPNRLRKYRLIFGFSQKKVAAMLGLKDASPLSRWERGASFPNLMQLFRLCRIYRVLPNDLYFGQWQNISQEMAAIEANLLAQCKPINTNETFYL